MNEIDVDATRPTLPELKSAASLEQLRAMQLRTRALASIYALVVFAFATAMAALVGLVAYRIFTHPESEDVEGDAVMLAVLLAFGLFGGIWLWIRVQELWEEHSHLKAGEASRINAIRDSYAVNLCRQSAEAVERYRDDVILMGREFTPHDLRVLDSYEQQVTDYNWNLKEWERAQSERQRLYGNADAADAAAQTVIGRLRKAQ